MDYAQHWKSKEFYNFSKSKIQINYTNTPKLSEVHTKWAISINLFLFYMLWQV